MFIIPKIQAKTQPIVEAKRHIHKVLCFYV